MNVTPQILLDAISGKLPGDDLARLTSEFSALLPAEALSVAAQGGIRIDGDGNIVGNNNVSIVVKGEGAGDLARVLRDALQRGRSLYQLRAPVADFVGRQTEIDQLLRVLRNGGRASISGMGGLGKSELALLVANQLRGDYPDAQLFIELHGTEAHPLTPSEALATCIRPFAGLDAKLPAAFEELARLYISSLSNNRVLVVLDNAANQEQVRPLLPPAGCALLVASRNAIALPGVQRFPLDELKPDEATSLLLSIAPHVPPEIAAEICLLCGYLPLAIRAAGSSLDVMADLDPGEYEQQLRGERTRLESIGTEGVEIGVEASINLSYARLDADAARVFRCLSVFPMSFKAAADEAVCEDPGHKHLSDLVRRSLVLYDRETKRYRLHDLMRLFAAEQRRHEGENETDAAANRHAAFYLTALGRANELFQQTGEASNDGLRLFDLEWVNIRAGRLWAETHADADDAAAAMCSSYAYDGAELIYLRLHPRERIVWGEAALAAARRLNDKGALAAHLHKLALAYQDLGEIARSIEYLKEALEINREIERPEYEAADLGSLGLAYAGLDEHRKAIKFYRQALDVYRVIDAPWGEGIYLSNLGSSYTAIGRARLAIKLHERALTINRKLGDRRSEGYTLGNLGAAYAALGDYQRALETFEQSLVIARELKDRQSEGYTLFGLSRALCDVGNRAEAIINAESALKILEEIEDVTSTKVSDHLAMLREK